MQIPQTWRTLLADILKQPGERQRIARALDINPLTLTRWTEDQSAPRPRYLQRLPTVIPEQQMVLSLLIAQEFPEFAMDASTTDEAPLEIASAFYTEVFHMLATLPPARVPWLIRKHILQHALEQLDPHRRGVIITLAQCVPPSTEHKVRSIQVMIGAGLPPWGGDVDQQAVFFGAESIAGRVVSTGQPVTIENLQETWLMEPPNMQGLGSLSVYPLQRTGRIAGTLSILSSQPGYFLPSRLTLIQQYSNLIAVTFAPENFYASKDIELCMMPPPPLQVPYLTNFRQRVLDILKEAANNQQPMTNAQAEQVACQQLEEELFHVALSINPSLPNDLNHG